jgi:hypothetical protein
MMMEQFIDVSYLEHAVEGTLVLRHLETGVQFRIDIEPADTLEQRALEQVTGMQPLPEVPAQEYVEVEYEQTPDVDDEGGSFPEDDPEIPEFLKKPKGKGKGK